MIVLRGEVESLILKMNKTLISKKCRFIVSNRDKNNSFCLEYSLSSRIIKEMIKRLTIYDFNKIISNSNLGYLDEKLYLFSPSVELINKYGKRERKNIYLKINYIEQFNTIIIISLHESIYKLKYAFK